MSKVNETLENSNIYVRMSRSAYHLQRERERDRDREKEREGGRFKLFPISLNKLS